VSARDQALAAGVPAFACDRIEETARSLATSDHAEGFGTDACVHLGFAQREATRDNRRDALCEAMESQGDVFNRATFRLAWVAYATHLMALNAGMVES